MQMAAMHSGQQSSSLWEHQEPGRALSRPRCRLHALDGGSALTRSLPLLPFIDSLHCAVRAKLDSARSEYVSHSSLKGTLMLCRTLWLEVGAEVHARSALQLRGRRSWLDKVPSLIAATGTSLSAWTSRPWPRKWAARYGSCDRLEAH